MSDINPFKKVRPVAEPTPASVPEPQSEEPSAKPEPKEAALEVRQDGVLHGGVEALLASVEREELVTLGYRLRRQHGAWLRDVAYTHARKNGGKPDASKVLRIILDEAMKASKKR